MKTISKQAVRNKAVVNVVASLHIERLTPSNAVVRAMHACTSGTETTANVIKEVIQRHVTRRRD